MFWDGAKEVEFVPGGVGNAGCDRVYADDGVAWDGANPENVLSV